MGVMLLAVLGLALPDTLDRTGGLRTALSVLVNGVAAALFIARADLAWGAVGLLAPAAWWAGGPVPATPPGGCPSRAAGGSWWRSGWPRRSSCRSVSRPAGAGPS